ncbi:uncharacterized protein LAESUDRAFT_666091, partial [Laetiporus sulphureus 93-53]
SLATSSKATCLDTSALISFYLASSSAPVDSYVDYWLKGMCAQSPCTNKTIAYLVTTAVDGCAADLTNYGLPNNTDELTSLAQQYYPTVREIACFTCNNTRCVTETLDNLQTVTGTITKANAIDIGVSIANGTIKLPSNVTCTNCTKEAYNLVEENHPNLITSGINNTIVNQCGSSFVDGVEPTTINQTADAAVSSASTDASGALGLSMNTALGIAVSSFVVLSSTVALLA